MSEPGTAGPVLSGLRIVDASRVLAGPLAAQILADQGADVIKVEPPQGDETRHWGPPFIGSGDLPAPMSAYFQGLNRNKRNVCLNLASEDDKERFLALIDSADVLIENFRDGALEKWGLGYRDTLSRRRPSLVHCRITGFGEGGEFGGLPGYDAVVQALSGLMSINGAAEGGPTRMGVPVVDIATGHYAALGVQGALIERFRSGVGQQVAVSLYDVALAICHPYAANCFAGGGEPSRQGNSHPNIAPYDLVPTATGPIYLAAGNDRQFRIAMTLIGAPELADDPRFASNAARLEHRPALLSAIRTLLVDRDGEALCRELLAHGVPAGVVRSVPQALGARHTTERNCVVGAGAYRGVASPIRYGRSPAQPVSAPAPKGADQDTRFAPPRPDLDRSYA